MGLKYLWDTNVAIYYLQQQYSPSAEEFVDSILREWQPALSAISEIELLCWKSARVEDVEILHNFIAESYIFELDNAVKSKTVEIRKLHRIKLPDAIIAATAIVYDLALLTRNISDFKGIPNLTIVNPNER